MAKTCLHCDRPVFSNKCCKFHQRLREDPKYLAQKNKVKKVTPIKSSGKPIKKPKKIRRLSKKREEEYKIYRPIRDKFLEDNPECQANLNGCTFYSTEVHHKIGKIGKLLYDIRYFLSCCHNCHSLIEVTPKISKELGLSADRLSNK